jgi:YfiH family protein
VERIENGLIYYRFAGFDDVNHGVFTRHGGVSAAPWDSLNLGGTVGDDVQAVRRNHELIYETLGVDFERTVTVWQVHGADTVLVNRPVTGRRWIAKADAMMTDQPGLALVMRYADCTPILVYDPVKRAIGIAHAGWRGTVQGMAANLVQAMHDAYGSRPADMVAAVGPAIGPDRYQVGEEVVDAAAHYFESIDGIIRRDPHDGTAYFDLWEANTRDLIRAGVRAGRIEVAGLCTATRTDEFFSHRGENGQTGRFGAVLCL